MNAEAGTPASDRLADRHTDRPKLFLFPTSVPRTESREPKPLRSRSQLVGLPAAGVPGAGDRGQLTESNLVNVIDSSSIKRVIAIFLSAFIQFSSAQTFFMGAHLGATDASGPITPKEVQFSYGGRFGWLFYDHVSFGALAHFYQSNQATESIGYFPLLAEVSFFPFKSPREDTSLFVSALFGTTKIVFDRGTQEGTDNQTTFGFAGGYSIFLRPMYSIGPEVQYLFVFDNDSYTFWSALLTFRVWF